MVGIAQSVEHLIVVQKVACSNHVAHPIFYPKAGKRKALPSGGPFHMLCLKLSRVHGKGLEPSCPKTQEPKSCASTIPPLVRWSRLTDLNC